MSLFTILTAALIIIISLRTLAWHLRSWQIREYRWDRMKAWLRTKDGKKSIWSLWFFPGVCPRPKVTLRILIILGFFVLINAGIALSPIALALHDYLLDAKFYIWFYLFQTFSLQPEVFTLLVGFICAERLIWITVTLSVFLSSLPVTFQRKRTFAQAKKIIHSDSRLLTPDSSSQNVINIGIAGSFGKSSTKNILVHLLRETYGKKNLLFTPENHNQELAIARLIIRNRSFFKGEEAKGRRGEESSPLPSFPASPLKCFVFETGAYARGEIKQIAETVQPQYAILTGLNPQHLDTFGSVRNIQLAKTELAQSTTKKIFYNADNELLRDIMPQVKTKAEKIPVSLKEVSDIVDHGDKTTFTYNHTSYTLPWPGEFFVINALLCLKVMEEMKNGAYAPTLLSLPPQDKALSSHSSSQGFTILSDLYSQNPDGTLHAINHLAKYKGPKIMIGMPLRELAGQSKKIHEQIFYSIKKAGITLYWTKSDYLALAQKILGSQVHPLLSAQDHQLLQNSITSWPKDTTVLLEGRLPQQIIKLFTP